MQNALKNAGKIMNAANAQINAQKDDPNATPETVAAGAVSYLSRYLIIPTPDPQTTKSPNLCSLLPVGITATIRP